MLMAEPMAETKMRLNLVIDKNSQKVLYAEAGKDFVDFLLHLLTLPVGSVIMQLTEKGMMGCLGDLYESVENLSETCMQPNQSKDPLLKPIHNWSYCLPTPKKFYTCPNRCRTVAHYPSAVCSNCRCTMTTQATYISPGNEKIGLPMEGGYVKGNVTYMVTDALVVKPLSTTSIVSILSEYIIINEAGWAVLVEKVVDFTMDQGLKLLLNASLKSDTVLTNVFLGVEDQVDTVAENQEEPNHLRAAEITATNKE